MRKIAYSYVRFSSPEQAKGFSKERQLALTTKYAESKGWTLDTSLSMSDFGKSAFKGDLPGLQAFLAAIKDGRIKPGSVLIVEKLDRLSRKSIRNAQKLWESILEQGVWIATTEPDRVYTEESLDDVLALLEAIIHFWIAHEQSKGKSIRAKDNWNRKRKLSKPLTSKCPAWISLKNGEFELNEKKAQVIRKIYQWCINGLGGRSILNKLHKEQIPNIAADYKVTSHKKWNSNYVGQILRDKKVFGEFQAYEIIDGIRTPIGEPRSNYFPPCITEDLYWQAQAARKSRFRQRGPRGRNTANLFQGIIFDAETGEPMRIVNSSQEDKKRGIMRRLGLNYANGLTWPYESFEKYFLKSTKEITAEHLKQKPTRIDPLPALREQLKTTQHQIESVTKKIENGSGFDAAYDLLERLDGKKKRLKAEIQEAKEAASIYEKSIGKNVISLIELFEQTPPDEQEELRLKLKAQIRLLVKEIWVHIIQVDDNRLFRVLVAQVFLQDGDYRTFMICTYRGKLVIATTLIKQSEARAKHGIKANAMIEEFEKRLLPLGDLRKLRERKTPIEWDFGRTLTALMNV